MKNGQDLMALAVSSGAEKSVEMLLRKGVKLESPPDVVEDMKDYRKTPYIFQAIKGGNQQLIEMVI